LQHVEDMRDDVERCHAETARTARAAANVLAEVEDLKPSSALRGVKLVRDAGTTVYRGGLVFEPPVAAPSSISTLTRSNNKEVLVQGSGYMQGSSTAGLPKSTAVQSNGHIRTPQEAASGRLV
jgi:hypothetical protein